VCSRLVVSKTLETRDEGDRDALAVQ